MIEQRGIVVAAVRGRVEVVCESQSPCGSCSAQGGCGTALLGRTLGRASRRVVAEDPLGTQTGESVVLGIAEGALLRAVFAAYLVPLLTLFGGALALETLATAWFPAWSQGASLAGGLAGLAAGLYGLRRFARRCRDEARFRARVLRRATASDLDGSGP